METIEVIPEVKTPDFSQEKLSSKPRRTPVRKLHKVWRYYLALIPTFLLLGLFGYYPALSGLYRSFYDWRPGFDSPFVGLDNFKTLLADKAFWDSFKNVAQFFVFGVTIAWLLPFFAAELVITLSSKRWQFIFRTLLIVPLAFPVVVQILVWGFIFDPQVGVLNTFLRGMGLAALERNWLGDPALALYSLMFINAPWIASIPFLIFLAGLQGIPAEILDATRIDGASRLNRVISIDVPLLGNQFKMLIILAIIQILQVAIPVALLTNGGPAYATMTPVLYLLNTAFVNSDWGYAATLSTTLFIIMLVLSLFVLWGLRPKDAAKPGASNF